MKQSPASPSRLSHLRSLVARFAFVLLVAASFALMMLGKADTVLAERLRTVIADVASPVIDLMSRPAGVVAEVVGNVRELSAIREENRHLREQNQLLLRWQTVAQQLEAQNDSLKSLLNFVPQPGSTFVTARVVADTGGAFAQSLLVTAGERELVQKGQAVVSGEGLVGRVAEVGRRSSRILLITDINSRIPVVVGNSHQRAILAGDNTNQPRLVYLRSPQAVVAGDPVVTSGDAGAFPPGLPVGVVTSINDNEIRIEPFLKPDRLDYVRIVDYGLNGILKDVTDKTKQETSP